MTSPATNVAHEEKVSWQPWGDEAFEQARREGKLVLLDIGAVWCHWCHVMDRTTYGDQRVADYINEHFIPVRVDRDEQPDIDRRYQSAPTLIGTHSSTLAAVMEKRGSMTTIFVRSPGRPRRIRP